MAKALNALRRVREAYKKRARLEHAAAERERQHREGVVISMEAALARSYAAREQGGAEAGLLAQEQLYQRSMQLDLSQAETALSNSESAVDRSRQSLVEADRDARVVELAIEREQRALEVERRRAEGRVIDEQAADGWRRKGA